MKLTRERLKQIIKEELEEGRFGPFDPYGSYDPKNPKNYNRSAEINAGLGPEDFQPQPSTSLRVRNTSSVPFKSAPTPLGNKIVPIINDMKFDFDKNETPEAKKTRQENVEKIRILGDLVFSLERGENSEKLNNLLKQVQEKGGVSKVLELIKDLELQKKVKDFLDQKQIQESKKLSRDKLKQIIKEELEEMIGTDIPSQNDEAYGKIYLAKKRIQQVLHEAEFDLRNLEDESAKRFVEKIKSMMTQLETE